MDKLESKDNQTLFTYKISVDCGSAPNPDGGVCSLAICKPVIRRTAKCGDIVVGLETGDTRRIIYCMEITKVLSWSEYINDPAYNRKSPANENDPGDRIWKNADYRHCPLPSHSGHGEGEFERDVKSGRNVLLSDKYWYFGKDEKFNFTLLDGMPLPNRGHLSRKNSAYKDNFIADFNRLLEENGVFKYGKHGDPDHPPGTNPEKIARCRVEERISDEHGEED
jgi:hypothetical protein